MQYFKKTQNPNVNDCKMSIRYHLIVDDQKIFGHWGSKELHEIDNSTKHISLVEKFDLFYTNV